MFKMKMKCLMGAALTVLLTGCTANQNANDGNGMAGETATFRIVLTDDPKPWEKTEEFSLLNRARETF